MADLRNGIGLYQSLFSKRTVGRRQADRLLRPAPPAEPLRLLTSVVLFYYGNAAMLPMAGQVLALKHAGSNTLAL